MEIRIKIGQDAFQRNQLVYVWFETASQIQPFYIGQTGKSFADRTGLHLRKCGDEEKSGSVVASIICRQSKLEQEYIIKAFELSPPLLAEIVAENANAQKPDSEKNAREAVERALYVRLVQSWPNIHQISDHAWSANCARKFIDAVENEVRDTTSI